MLYSSRFMTNESAIFIELKIVFEEIQPLLEIKFSLFHIQGFLPYPLLNFIYAGVLLVLKKTTKTKIQHP